MVFWLIELSDFALLTHGRVKFGFPIHETHVQFRKTTLLWLFTDQQIYTLGAQRILSFALWCQPKRMCIYLPKRNICGSLFTKSGRKNAWLKRKRLFLCQNVLPIFSNIFVNKSIALLKIMSGFLYCNKNKMVGIMGWKNYAKSLLLRGHFCSAQMLLFLLVNLVFKFF